MSDLVQRLQGLSSAEQFLDFFGVAYEQTVVNVSRLHILKRFHQYVRLEPGIESMDEVALFARYRELLARAYGDFVRSTPAKEKVFKVFQDQDGRAIPLAALAATLPSAR